MADKTKSVWETLSRIDVSEHTEDKNGFTYLSWAWAWSTLKDHYPFATFEKHVHPETHLPFFHDGETGNAFVKVTVTAGGDSMTETFPVLDYKNKPIVNPSAFEINTALQRCLAKAISYLGLGAYIYAGEDLPPAPNEAMFVGPDGSKHDVSGPDMVASVFREFLPSIDNVESLTKFYKTNSRAISIVQSKDPQLYATLINEFKHRKEEINGVSK